MTTAAGQLSPTLASCSTRHRMTRSRSVSSSRTTCVVTAAIDSSNRWDDLFTRCTRGAVDAQSPEGGKPVALFGGTEPADRSRMRHPLKVTATVTLLAYVAGAVAVLWRERAW